MKETHPYFPYKSVLIVCSVNTARSPMAEGFLKNYFSNHNLNVEVYSGGISSNARDGMLISLDAKLAMKELGIILPEDSLSIDLKKHPQFIYKADLILTLTKKHKEEVLKFLKNNYNENEKVVISLAEFAGEGLDIQDPAMKGLKGFRKARDQIREYLYQGLEKYK